MISLQDKVVWNEQIFKEEREIQLLQEHSFHFEPARRA